MLPSSSAERILQIAAVPHELGAYQRWLDEQRRSAASARDYLFSEERPRFEPRKDDVVVALPGLQVRQHKGKPQLVSADGRNIIALDGVSAKQAEQLLAALDGERCLLEARWHAGVEQTVLARFLRATFGRVLLAPAAVEALETALPAVEISRFPSSPYSVERPYWENMIAVRQRFMSRRAALEDSSAFVTLLRELHVVALMGERLDCFYKPASPVADTTVAPGNLFPDPPRLREGGEHTIFLDGPRVKVPLLGGPGYHRALCRGLGDPEALDDRELEEEGLSWGRVVTARSERDAEPGPWFCPPRPFEEAHFAYLRQHLAAALRYAEAGEIDETVRSLARFHRGSVRLHPFHCANQSLAMNLVNAVLGQALGAGIPHLILDHLALRLRGEAYEALFARAVDAFAVVQPDPSKRLAELLERKQRSFAVIQALGSCDSDSAAKAAIASDREGARWALLGEG